jgi:nucleoside-diphosphate-sugar epimerase
MGKEVIIFGANGFLGSLMTKKLHASGFNVLPVIRPRANQSRLSDLDNLDVLERESSEWPGLINEYNPSAIICAQWNGVSKQDRENLEVQKTNIEPILNIAISAKASQVGSFICFGSQAESKEGMETIGEEFCNSGESSYGIIKAELHSQLLTLFEDSECRFIWARVFSVYGPSDFSDSLLMRLFESQVSGDELVILNPSKFWSYLYEDDFASAIESILKDSRIAKTINIGNPLLNTISEIVAIWHESSATSPNLYNSNQTNLGFFPDVSKLKSVGWSPSISLEEGVKRTRKALSDRLDSK